MDCCREPLPNKGGMQQYIAPKRGSLCMLYATRPGDTALVQAKMTPKLCEYLEKLLEEKGRIVLPDDIFFFDHPDQKCEVAPRITFKMVIGPEGFVYKDEETILQENQTLSQKMQQLIKVGRV